MNLVWLIVAAGIVSNMAGKGFSKYHAKKVKVNGMTFDSKHEYERWCELRLLERTGEICGLQRQVPFELLPAQKDGNKCLERKVVYKADFVYTHNGEIIVEDAKGMKTPEYIIKRKLMLYRHGIKVKEV